MKKLLITLTAFLFGSSLFAQTSFTSLSFITFKSNLSFILGEGSQTLTIKRDLQPFAINKFETTYSLWYNVRIKAEEMGYYFQNPGQTKKIITNSYQSPVNIVFPTNEIKVVISDRWIQNIAK